MEINISPNYFVLLVLVAFDIFTFFIILTIEFFLRNFYRQKRNLPPLSFLWNFKLLWFDLLIYIILANHVGQVLPFLNQFFCLNTFGTNGTQVELVLISDLRISCESFTHNLVKYIISLPLIIISCFLIPFYLIFTKKRGFSIIAAYKYIWELLVHLSGSNLFF